jgi:hypothetical protein
MFRFQTIIVAAILSIGTVANAQMTPIVRMNCQGGAAWPNCGASRTVGNNALGSSWERAYIASEDAVEIYMRPGASGEGYYGWQWTGFPAPSAGATRVLRAKIKVVSPVNWGNWGDKFMVVGDVSNDAPNRIISTMSMYQGQPHLNVDKNIYGYYAHGFLTPDRYTAVQIVAAPVTPGSNTYNFKFYVDGVLTRTSVNFTVNPASWRDFNVGYYGQYGNGGHVRIRFKDVEFDDEYDPNYHTATQPPPPPPCVFGVSPLTTTLPASASDDTTGAVIKVTPSAPTCTWTATSLTSWLQVTPGSGQVVLTASANTGTARSGAANVAGQVVTVIQEAAPEPPPPQPPPPPAGFSGVVETTYVNGLVVGVRVTATPQP